MLLVFCKTVRNDAAPSCFYVAATPPQREGKGKAAATDRHAHAHVPSVALVSPARRCWAWPVFSTTRRKATRLRAAFLLKHRIFSCCGRRRGWKGSKRSAWGKMSKVYGGRARGGVCEVRWVWWCLSAEPRALHPPLRVVAVRRDAQDDGEAATSETGAGQQKAPAAPHEPQPPERAPANQWTCTVDVLRQCSTRTYRSNTQRVEFSTSKPRRPTDLNREAKGSRQVPLCVNVPCQRPSSRKPQDQA